MDAAEADGAAFLAVQPIGLTSPGGWRMPRVTKKRIALALGLLMFMALGSAYTQKDTLSPKVADYSRNVIGDENTAKVESYFFRISDKVDKLKYKILGGETNPFTSGVTVEFVSPPKGKVFVYYTGDGKTPSSSQLTVDSLAPLITEPALVMWGAHDPIFHRSSAARLGARIPHVEVTVFPNCGHLCPVSQAEELAERYLRFLREQHSAH